MNECSIRLCMVVKNIHNFKLNNEKEKKRKKNHLRCKNISRIGIFSQIRSDMLSKSNASSDVLNAAVESLRTSPMID